MKLLFKQATILDTSSKYHLSQQDVLIEDGVFLNIDTVINETADQVITTKDLFISTGFIDVCSHFNDPGFEQKETLITGALAAQKGGYVAALLMPNTNPTIDNKASVEYLLPIQILPIAAVTTNTEGKNLSEMIEMHKSGAVAFSDGMHGVQNAGLLVKALQYVKNFDGTIIQVPYDTALAKNGLVHEGVLSTQLGLPGIPGIAEEILVARDIELCAYTDSRLHLTGISTAKSVALIAAAKANNTKLTCSVTPYHLLLTDAEIKDYNTAAKVNPPLRSTADIQALQQALKDGVIDCIASHHLPQEIDAKQCEFVQAQFGMSTIETTFQAIASIPASTPLLVYESLSKNVKTIFGLPETSIAIGNACKITAFTMYNETIVDEQQFLSKGKHTAFAGKKLFGNIIATINEHHQYIAN
jgi:dihydroorotase